jgi:hypothetical protein
MLAILSLIPQLVTLGLEVAPQVIAAGKLVLSLIESKSAPTPDQQSQIDAALKQAHEALQAA